MQLISGCLGRNPGLADCHFMNVCDIFKSAEGSVRLTHRRVRKHGVFGGLQVTE